MKQYLILLFLTVSCLATAQHLDLNHEIREIDSLIRYNQFDDAQKKADQAYNLLQEKYKGKEYLNQKLEVRFLQGIIKDSRFDHDDALPVFMEILKMAEKNKLHYMACRATIRIAFIHEKAGNEDLAYKYLLTAKQLCKDYKLDDLYSALFIRYAFVHRYVLADNFISEEQKRRLAALNFKASHDSTLYYIQKAIQYALKYKKEYDLNEAYMTMGIIESPEARRITYFQKVLPYWKKTNNHDAAAMMYRNIAKNYAGLGELNKALTYNDSGYRYQDRMSVFYKYSLPLQRAELFESLKNVDSAHYYLKIAYKNHIKRFETQEIMATKQLEEEYQNDKKEAAIKTKQLQIALIASILLIIFIATVLLIRKNRQIQSQNKVISKQLVELSKILEQKQVLLSELQHRVKNNLQHVISILEIQKESVTFNNINELIRGNQNRIHSMALLHKKLNVSDNVNEVNLPRYITELAELVKESYHSQKKTISLNINCDEVSISVEKALPIGLIIVELVSNSMKHAFRKRTVGIINIEFYYDQKTSAKTLHYTDNGTGYDFNSTNHKGLGNEIIKGLIDQLDATVETSNANGFELKISHI
jgi:two-component sensor histidine kinase